MWRAVFLMMLGMSCIPGGDTAGKVLTNSYGVEPLFVAWSRFAIGAVVALALFGPGRLRILNDWRVWFRALLLAMGISSILTALQTAPLADVFGAFFIGPAVSYILSATLLKEPVSRGQTALLILGFLGVLMVVQPGLSPQPGIGFALLAGLFYGAFLTASKWLVSSAEPKSLLVSQLVLPAVFMAPIGVSALPEMSLDVAALTSASALLSALGNLLLVYAMTLAPSTKLAPLVYFQIVAATVLGLLVFGSLPNALAFAGLAVVLLSGLAGLLQRR